jgi:hypothetical protein
MVFKEFCAYDPTSLFSGYLKHRPILWGNDKLGVAGCGYEFFPRRGALPPFSEKIHTWLLHPHKLWQREPLPRKFINGVNLKRLPCNLRSLKVLCLMHQR